MTVRVRYAPSPTGLQHIGSVRTALFNYLFARAHAGVFILRIEDTDRDRYSADALQDIYDTFDWLGFRWDEGPDCGGEFGPYIQSERAEHYTRYAQQLVDAGHAYYAYDTQEELAAQREASDGKGGYDRRFRDMSEAQIAPYRDRGIEPVIRFKSPLDGTTTLTDIVLGSMSWENQDLPADPILVKSDGMPTYHLANVVDDHLMEITHILRAQEWIPSAPLHLQLYDRFGWTPPRYCHLPMVVGDDGQKLSKRHGATRVLEFRERGYLPEAIINYLARVGWSYDGERELFTLTELEALFAAERINKSPAVFDYQKLDWLNGHYIREASDDRLVDALMPYLRSSGVAANVDDHAAAATLRAAVPLVRERLKTLDQIGETLGFAFSRPAAFDITEMVPKKLSAGETVALVEKIVPLLDGIAERTDEENESLFRETAERLQTKLGNLLMPLRIAVTGSKVSPPLFGSIRLVGTVETRARVELALDRLRAHAAENA